MKNVEYAKSQDRISAHGSANAGEPIDVSPLIGSWFNTNDATTGITSLIVTCRDNELSLRVFAAAEPEPNDWGETRLNALFAESIHSPQTISFTAGYDFGFLETELQSNISKGLMIVTALNTFKDGSARSDYFSREYFYKIPCSD